QGEVTRVDESDLRFADDELAAFAALRDVPVERVTPSGGWPALAELAVAAGDASRARSGVIIDYLWEEVLESIAPDRRRLVAALAAVGSFDQEIAAAVAGHPVDLDELASTLPLVLSEGDGRLRLHALWRSALAHEIDEATTTRARISAADVLLHRGDLDEAMALYVVARAWNGLRAVILEGCTTHRVP